MASWLVDYHQLCWNRTKVYFSIALQAVILEARLETNWTRNLKQARMHYIGNQGTACVCSIRDIIQLSQ